MLEIEPVSNNISDTPTPEVNCRMGREGGEGGGWPGRHADIRQTELRQTDWSEWPDRPGLTGSLIQHTFLVKGWPCEKCRRFH